MNEYSTMENVLQVHSNDSEHFLAESIVGLDTAQYKHVESIKSTGLLPSILDNVTEVTCSPRFSLRK